jgi:(p)ppGpp synthase/HD superfamily hydrolase
MKTLVEKAQAFAVAKHQGQKGKRPGESYVRHVESVVDMLEEHGYRGSDLLSAAYLHDCLEKTDATIAELLREFGEEVAELVYWLTDPEDSEGPEKELLSAWLLGRAPVGAKLIKLADIIDNAEAIRVHDPARWRHFREGKSTILAHMARMEGDDFAQLPLFKAARKALDPQ